MTARAKRRSHNSARSPWTATLLLCAACVLAAVIVAEAGAQVSPNLKWRTMDSQHFRVHFSPGLASFATDAINVAERAWVNLARELKAPRGKIDLVVADNRDFANGYASAFPTNRIVIYAMPPTDVPLLRGSNNWLESVVTHELTHIFHLDRTEGLWRAARWVFGRNPSMMPNRYAPAWITEGLAVYYESKLTSEGRLTSGEHHMIVRAAAEHGRLLGIGDMSLATSREPEGHTPYVFGAELIEFLALRGGPGSMNEFVGSMSAMIPPYLYSVSAKRKLGISFGDAWRQYSDSIQRVYGTASAPFSDWTPLTTFGRTAWYPRWLSADTLVYARSDGRSSPGLYTLTTDGESERVARRNSVTINAPGPDGSFIFSQPEFSDPYIIRFDLYKRDRDGRETRLTRGARLTAPDVRADGEIVAVQAGAGHTSIVRVSATGESITPVAGEGGPGYWADPCWSPDGRQIVAVRRDPSGTSALVVIDENLTQVRLYESTALIAAPTWLNPNRILFQRDSGRSQIALAPRSGAAGEVFDISRASTAVEQPDVSPPRPVLGGGAARKIAAVEYTYLGYRIGVAPLQATPASSNDLPPAGLYRSDSPATAAASVSNVNAAGDNSRPYSFWRFMIPRYWVPLAANAEDGNVVVGGSTSAYDVVDRHAYAAELLVNTGNGVVDGSLNYSYAGLGRPLISVSARQNSGYSGIFSGTPRARVGFLREQSRSAAMSLQFSRPRFRNSASLSFGGEFERLTYDSDPANLLGMLTNFDPAPREFFALSGGFGWSNTRRPALSISPEDGVSLSLNARERWRRGSTNSPSLSVTGALRAFKSLDLPGFSHHVLAVRIAAGSANSSTTTRFSVGGKSGSKLELFPGYSIGDVGRTFPVRGFEAGTLVGLRAMSGSLEYRLPIAKPSRGLGMLPLFFDRVSMALFADAGAAWCPASYAALTVCDDIPTSPKNEWIASAGAELNLDAALQYDVPYRFRLGFANIVRKPADLVAKRSEIYFTLGFPF